MERQNHDGKPTPDLIFFYSEPLVEKIYDPVIQCNKLIPLGVANLATEYEYRRLSDVLKGTGA